jgi:uncharacterized protein (DUF2235 family)
MAAPNERGLVVCCDGTGQTIRAAAPPLRGARDSAASNAAGRSNILRLFDLLVKDAPDQIVFYDPGIGTLPGLERESPWLRRARNARDEWLGSGLMENVAEAYRFLMHTYQPGDRVFLFGFSRGAFTVRTLAGLIRSVGLLRPENDALVPSAGAVVAGMAARHRRRGWRDREADDELACQFERYTRPGIPIAFLGVFDTVKAYGYLNPVGMPFQRNNDLVEIARQAVSIDERRRPFQVTGLSDRRLRQAGLDDDAIDRRVQEVWFAGDHSDVGGGHADGDNILAKAPFDWMLREAMSVQLRVDLSRYEAATGWPAGARAPDNLQAHDLLRGAKGLIFRAPWRDLNNTHFPPDPRWRFEGGARSLVCHAFPDPVWRLSQGIAPARGDQLGRADATLKPTFVRVHDAVLDRYARGLYRPANLQALFASDIERRSVTVPSFPSS